MAVDDLYRRACEALETGNYDYAIELFREVLRQNPEYPNARVALRGAERRRLEGKPSIARKVLAPLGGVVIGIKSLLSRDPRKRLERYEDLLEKSPNSVSALIGAARAAHAAGFNESAVLLLKDALKRKSRHKGALRLIADSLRDAGRRKEALTYLNRLLEMHPDNRELQQEIRDLQAVDHMETYEMEGAESFRDLIREKAEAKARGESEPEEAAPQETAAKRPEEEAIAQMLKELETDPENLTKIVRLSMLYQDIGDYENARKVVKDALEKSPDDYSLLERLGDLELHVRDRRIAEVEAQLHKEPDRADLKNRLEQLQRERMQFTVQEYKWRVDRHPTDADLHFRLGLALFDTADYNGAIAAFQRAANVPGLMTDTAKMLGLCFMRKGQYDLAIEQLGLARDRHPNIDDKGKDILYLLAEAHEASGNAEEALKLYKRIYSADINFRDVAQKVDALSK